MAVKTSNIISNKQENDPTIKNKTLRQGNIYAKYNRKRQIYAANIKELKNKVDYHNKQGKLSSHIGTFINFLGP